MGILGGNENFRWVGEEKWRSPNTIKMKSATELIGIWGELKNAFGGKRKANERKNEKGDP